MICDSTFSGLSYQSMARTDTSFQPSPSNTFFLPISRSEKVLSDSRCSASSRIPSLYRSGRAGSVIPRSTRKEERPIPQTAFRPCFCRASFISRAMPLTPWSLRRSRACRCCLRTFLFCALLPGLAGGIAEEGVKHTHACGKRAG